MFIGNRIPFCNSPARRVGRACTPNVLVRLHDFEQPLPPSWTPHTIGWYIVFAVLLGLVFRILWRAIARWRNNRYRRLAMRELEHTAIVDVPALLKRTALGAFGRDQVASLSGEEWLHFLDAHASHASFLKQTGRLLLDVDYREASLTSDEETELRKLVGEWIRGHRVRA